MSCLGLPINRGLFWSRFESMQTWLYVLCCTWQGCFCDLRTCRHDVRVSLYVTGVFFWPENVQTRLHVLWCTWQGCFCDLRTCRHDFTCCDVHDRDVFVTWVCRHDIRVVLYVTGVFFWPPTWQQADKTSRVVLWREFLSDPRPENMQAWLHVLCYDMVFFPEPRPENMQTWLYVWCCDGGVLVTLDLTTGRQDFTCYAMTWVSFWHPTWEHADMTSRVVLWHVFLFVFSWPSTWEHADMTLRVVLWRWCFGDPRPDPMQTWLYTLCCAGGVFLTFDLRTCWPDFTCCAVTGVFLWPLTGDHANMTSRVVLCRGCFCDLRPKNMQTWRHVLCCDKGVLWPLTGDHANMTSRVVLWKLFWLFIFVSFSFLLLDVFCCCLCLFLTVSCDLYPWPGRLRARRLDLVYCAVSVKIMSRTLTCVVLDRGRMDYDLWA